MTTRRTATRLPMLIATIAMVVGLMPAAPATAHVGAAAPIIGTAYLPTFPCPAPSSCAGSFDGTAVLAVAGTSAGVAVPASATFNYTDDCVTGTATGAIVFSGGVVGSASESLHFAWTRVGLTALLIIDGAHTGAGAAAFVPGTGATVCATGGTTWLTASVAGDGVWL